MLLLVNHIRQWRLQGNYRFLPWWCLIGLLLGSAQFSLWACALLLLLPWYRPRWHGLVMTLCFVLAYWQVEQAIRHRLPLVQDQHQRWLAGTVTDVVADDRVQRLTLRLNATLDNQQPRLRRIRASYYGPLSLKVGDQLEMQVKLRAPRNLRNGLAFDYEVWLLANGIDASGYIRAIRRHVSGQAPARQQVRQKLLSQLPKPLIPWLDGLVFAETGSLPPSLWRLGQATGTVHLLVVSGLHLALVGALGWGLALLLGRISAAMFPPPVFGVASPRRHMMPIVLGWLVVLAIYVWLASAGIAIWRASLMACLAAFLVLGLRRWSPITLLAWVAVALLLINPLAHQLAGYFMSLLVVAALVLMFQGRKTPRWHWLWLPSWLAWWVLLPLLMMWLQPVSGWHGLANIIAVPLVSLLLLPALLLRAVFAGLSWDGALVWWLDRSLLWLVDVLQQWLQWVAIHSVSWPPLSIAMLLLWWGWALLLWLGLPARLAWFGTALLLMLAASPVTPTAQIRFLDVGQGLSVVAVADQVLVYDVGARWSSRFNMGEAVVAPSLRQMSVPSLSTLVLSHSDNDHAGGYEGLKFWYRPDYLWSGQVHPEARSCHLGGISAWYTLSAQLSYRFFSVPIEQRDNDNNHSCVMQLRWYGQRILLAGDIEARVERELVRRYDKRLKSDWLVVSHHGSRSSSSEAWLQTVAPSFALISSGWHNRFDHPHPQVLQALQQRGIRVWRTDVDGGAVLLPDGQFHGLDMTSLSVWKNR